MKNLTNPCNTVILIEDEEDVREAARLTLELEGYSVHTYSSADKALPHISEVLTGIVVSDVRMPGTDGLELLQKIISIDSELPVILVTGHGDIEMALQAVRHGAWDFIEKPVPPDRLIDEVSRAIKSRQLELENRALRQQLDDKQQLDNQIIGSCPAMVALRNQVRNIADADVDILIHGETGTGKELLASSLHQFSKRADKEFVALNCGALPESVIESELFGHEAGAFTGANKRRIGKIEFAQGGTLFLDELESMPMHLQIRMLRVLQERKLERLGGNTSIPVDIRVIAATKCDLLEAASRGEFREDLYYRLNVATLHIPPLRERADDIPLLFRAFVLASATKFGRQEPELNPQHFDLLQQQEWRGNVRELQHEAERLVLGISTLFSQFTPAAAFCQEQSTLPEQLASYERKLLSEALQKSGGKVQEAAELLGIPRKKLYLRMQKFDLHKEQFYPTESA